MTENTEKPEVKKTEEEKNLLDTFLDRLDGRKKRLAEKLIATRGLVTSACIAANVSRATYYNWYNDDPLFAEVCDEILERTFDAVENCLLKNINNGDTTAIIFYCKTKMKHRGYSERLEISGTNGDPIQTQTNINFLTNEADIDAVMRLKIQAVKEHKELEYVKVES